MRSKFLSYWQMLVRLFHQKLIYKPWERILAAKSPVSPEPFKFLFLPDLGSLGSPSSMLKFYFYFFRNISKNNLLAVLYSRVRSINIHLRLLLFGIFKLADRMHSMRTNEILRTEIPPKWYLFSLRTFLELFSFCVTLLAI